MPDDALEALRELQLEIQETLPEGDSLEASRGRARGLRLLATIAFYRSDLHDAETFIIESLEVHRTALAGFYEELASTLDQLAQTYAAQRRDEDLKRTTGWALAVREAGTGPNPKSIWNLGLLGVIAEDDGDWPLRESYLLRSLEMNEVLYGNESLEVARHLRLMGTIYEEHGEAKKAAEARDRAADVYRVLKENEARDSEEQ